MRRSVRRGFGMALGRAVFRLTSLLLGVALVSVLGLVLAGQPQQALLVALAVALPWLVLGRLVRRRGAL